MCWLEYIHIECTLHIIRSTHFVTGEEHLVLLYHGVFGFLQSQITPYIRTSTEYVYVGTARFLSAVLQVFFCLYILRAGCCIYIYKFWRHGCASTRVRVGYQKPTRYLLQMLLLICPGTGNFNIYILYMRTGWAKDVLHKHTHTHTHK